MEVILDSTKKYKYVRWSSTPLLVDTPERLNELLSELNLTQIQPQKGCNTLTSINAGSNCFFRRDNLFYIFYDVPFRVLVKEETTLTRQEREGALNGNEAFKRFLGLVKTECGSPLHGLVDVVPPRLYTMIRACVSSQLCWSAESGLYNNIYKADVSSAFPFEGCKRLPTFHDHLEYKDEVVLPNSDYPFAFYANGTLAWLDEDGSFHSTEEFYHLPYSTYYYRRAEVENSREQAIRSLTTKATQEFPTTVLCRAATTRLSPVFEKLYTNKKNGDAAAKAIMNYFIGYCWRKSKPQYAHIAALILAYTNLRMMEMVLELVRRNQKPLLLATDSIAWQGCAQPDLTVKQVDKTLGSFVIEHENCILALKSSKAYQIQDGSTVLTLWAGVKKTEAAKRPFGAVLGEDVVPLTTVWDDKTQRYVQMEVNLTL